VHAVAIGDVQGHADALEAALAAAGVDLSGGTIPGDVPIVQVGDLVHRGPDCDTVISLVDRFIRLPNWVQLIGNHEGTYLDTELPGIARQLSADSRDTFGWRSSCVP
jgi:hypothetical protein